MSFEEDFYRGYYSTNWAVYDIDGEFVGRVLMSDKPYRGKEIAIEGEGWIIKGWNWRKEELYCYESWR